MNGRKAKARRRREERVTADGIEVTVRSDTPLTASELREALGDIPDGMSMPLGAVRILMEKEVLAIRGREILFVNGPDQEAVYAEGVGGGEYDGALFLRLPQSAFDKLDEGRSSAAPNDDATAVTLYSASGAVLCEVPLIVAEDTVPADWKD